MKSLRNAFIQATFDFSNQLNKLVKNIYNMTLLRLSTQKIMLTDRFNILHDFTNCQFISVLTEADPNKIPHKICFSVSQQNEMKDFPQYSRKAKQVATMNIFTGFKCCKNPYIRTRVSRNISLKFHNSFCLWLKQLCFRYEN